MIALILAGSALLLGMMACWKYRDKLFADNRTVRIAIVLAAALVVRLVLAASVRGYSVDMNCFTAWADMAYTQGIPHMYAYAAQNGIFLDYPPGYMFILYVIGLLRNVLSLSPDSSACWVLVKLPPTLFELGAAVLIWRLLRKKGNGAAGLVAAATYAFHPAFLVTTSLWGQVDGVFVFFLLLAFVWLLEKRHIASTIAYAVALLVKPQALVFFPVYLWYIIDLFVKKEKGALLLTLKCVGVGVLVFAAGVLPFSAGQDWNWIFKLYTSTLASYEYATLNTFNLYALFGANFVGLDQTLLGVPYTVWGMVLIAVAVLTSALVYVKRGVLTAAAYLNIALCLFGTKMHERYLLPSLALLLVAFVMEQRTALRPLFGVFSFTVFLNIGYVLVLSLQPQPVYHIPAQDALMIAVSVINLAAFVPLAYYCFGGNQFETVIKKRSK